MANLLETNAKGFTYKLAAGSYYIGDPCYVIGKNHADWCSILDASDYFKKPFTNEKQQTAVAFNTAYGDGEYTDKAGRQYGVDAGLIGAVPVEMLEVSVEEINKRKLGHIISFSTPFTCEESNGVLRFGHIKIDTN